ncbi:hypothetical protein HOY80DRAFT_886577, partial [Tuber brumale]
QNVIEGIFGAVKRKFPILKGQPEYPLQSQVKLLLALTRPHNFIQKKSTLAEIAYESELDSASYNLYPCR